MTNLLITIHNLENDQIIQREMTEEETIVYENSIAEIKELKKIQKDKELQRLELLQRLGLTAEEAAVLLG